MVAQVVSSCIDSQQASWDCWADLDFVGITVGARAGAALATRVAGAGEPWATEAARAGIREAQAREAETADKEDTPSA